MALRAFSLLPAAGAAAKAALRASTLLPWGSSTLPVGVFLGQIKNRWFSRKEILTAEQLGLHVHVVGASGFGKTVLLSHIIKQKIQNGEGVLFLDLKGDIETITKFSNYVFDANRTLDLHIFSISNQKLSLPYNLIAGGTATQLRDRIMMSLNWSEEYYKNQSSSFLLKLLIGLVYLRDNFNQSLTLNEILKATSSQEYLKTLCNVIPLDKLQVRTQIEDCYNFLSSSDNYKSLQGLRAQLESIVLSDFGDMVISPNGGMNLFDVINEGKIAFIFLDSRRYGETSKAVGKFILQDLKAVSAKIDAEVPASMRKPFTVVIDEFSDLAQEDFISFLDRARSSKISIMLAHQEMSDLKRVSNEFAARLIGNTSTLYSFCRRCQRVQR